MDREARYGDLLPTATPRLRFRTMVDTDFATLNVVLNAREFGRSGPRDAAHWIRWNQENYVRHGFGLWALETHEGAFVGDCGLTMQDVEGASTVEVGYHVHPDLRGCGLATEAASAVRDAARDAGVAHLVAIIRPENLPSQRVAQKIGLSLERTVFKNGGDALIFGADL